MQYSVLAINGKKDVQVMYKDNLTAIEKALSKNKKITIKTYDNLNHLFQHCEIGLVSEYATTEETISPQVLTDLVSGF